MEVFGLIGEEFDVTVGNFDSVGYGLGLFGRELPFRRAFEVELIAWIAVVFSLQRGYCVVDRHVVCLGVFLLDVVNVVGCNEAVRFLGDKMRFRLAVFSSACRGPEFEEKFWGQGYRNIQGRVFRRVRSSSRQASLTSPRRFPESPMSPSAYSRSIFVDTWFVIHAFEVRSGDEFYEVVISGLGFCE